MVDGYPLNPTGRTDKCLRGVLGRWGPNHAVDPIVTKWKDDAGHKILSVVLIRRQKDGSWALPGGFVDEGEDPKHAASREFMEEALSILTAGSEQKRDIESKLKPLFESGVAVWKGVVEADGRNTDNAWIESIGYHFHDETKVLDSVQLKAGDDATDVKWFTVSHDLRDLLITEHWKMVEKAAERIHASL